MSERRRKLPVEAGDRLERPAPQEHRLRIRDLRLRFGAPEMYGAQCTCGWTGQEHRGSTGERLARRDGRRHEETERAARHPARPGPPAAR
jgi:hypothetical protein